MSQSLTTPITRYAQALWRRRGLACAVVVIVLAIAVPTILALPALYKSTATLLVQGQVSDPLLQSQASGGDSQLQAINQEALTRTHLSDLVDRFGLYPETRAKGPIDPVLQRLVHDIKVDVTSTEQVNGQPTTVAFTVTYTGRDAQQSADVANALASFYVAQSTKIRSGQATRTAELLQQQLEDLKKQLDARSDKVNAFAASHAAAIPSQAASEIEALQRLSGQLQISDDAQMKLIERRQSLQSQIADLDTHPATAATDVEARLAAQRKKLADLQSQYTAINPDVKQAKKELDDLQKQVGAEHTTKVDDSGTMRATLEASQKETEAQLQQIAKDREGLTRDISQHERSVAGAAVQQPQMEAITRDYQSTRDLYDSLMKRYSDARLAERVETSDAGEDIRVLDPAVAAPAPFAPHRAILLGMALIAACVLAWCAVLVTERMDTSFAGLDDLQAFTRVPVLASIPNIVTPKDRRRTRAKVFASAVGLFVVAALFGAAAFHFAAGNDALARLLSRLG
jgi:polysaccharide chain length determinant protein (PEP-CTERM system associated)